MTTIYIYDPKDDGSASATLTPLPTAALIIAAWNLLDQACDLVPPVQVTVSDLQSISMQFASEQLSVRVLTRWAARFGGLLSSELHHTERGPQTWCRVEFDYYGVAVKAFAHIPADTGPAVI